MRNDRFTSHRHVLAGGALVIGAAVACGDEALDSGAAGRPDDGRASSGDRGTTSAHRDGGAAATDSPRASPGCTSPKLTPGTEATLTLEHDGRERTFLLKVGRSVDASKPVPLWIDWHGLASDATQQKLYSGSARIADERGLVVAYPLGIGKAFNAGVCCSGLALPPHEADDVGFGRAIVAKLGSEMCLDLRRVYSLGMSNGGFMSEYNACFAADLYAAIAPVSALGPEQKTCTLSRPVPMIAFNGTEDRNVSYSGSRESIAVWRTREGCSGDPVRVAYGQSFCETWKCAAGTELTSCTVTGMSHCWPGNPLKIDPFCDTGGLADIDASKMMADFFERFALPN